MSRDRIPERLQVWIDARPRHHLSHAHVQMARELGLNPTKLGKLDNHGEEPWKAPVPRQNRVRPRRTSALFLTGSQAGGDW